IYCSVIEACGEIFDLRRAPERTSTVQAWCASQPDVVPYRGLCLIRRAEILQLHGEWSNALDEAQSACERLSQPTPKPPVGAAFYRKGDVHRLRGEFLQAEEAYRMASQWERIPRPGMALLWLAQGKIQSANAAIRHIAEEVQELGRRAQVLEALVEIALSATDVSTASASAQELTDIAIRLDAPFLHALAARATGAVLLA